MFVVFDARTDPRFMNNPLVTGPPFVTFYAGAAIIVKGQKLGSLCIIDTKPREFFTPLETCLLFDFSIYFSNMLQTSFDSNCREQKRDAKRDATIEPKTLISTVGSEISFHSTKNFSNNSNYNPTVNTVVNKDAILLVQSFYQSLKCMSLQSLIAITSENSYSCSGESCKETRDQFIVESRILRANIPDLGLDIKETIVSADGNKVTVRCEISGTLQSRFVEIPFSTNSRFKIMSIDIHTIEKGKLIRLDSTKDWMSTVKLLTGETAISTKDNYFDLSNTLGDVLNNRTDLQARAEVIAFPYYDCINDASTIAMRRKLKSATNNNNWISISGEGRYRDQLGFIRQIFRLRCIIPDLRCDVKEVIPSADGSRITVRSVVTGTPIAPIFGVSNSRLKSFSICRIDIHSVICNKLSQVYHVEDWRAVLIQLQD